MLSATYVISLLESILPLALITTFLVAAKPRFKLLFDISALLTVGMSAIILLLRALTLFFIL